MQIETIVQSGHYLGISDIEFSPDGNTIATCSPDESVRLWDIAMGCETAVLMGHRAPVYCVAFNNDGSLLASCSWDLTVRIWEPVSRVCKLVLDSTDQYGMVSIDNICFSSSGRMIASAGMNRFNGPNRVTIWDTHSGKKLKSHEVAEKAVSALAFSRDEKLLAIAMTQMEHVELRIIDAVTGDTIQYLKHAIDDDKKEESKIRQTPSASITFSSDGKSLFFACKKKLHKIKIKEKTTAELIPVENDVFKIELRDNGQLLAFGKNVILIDFDLNKQTEVVGVAASEMNSKGDLLARSVGRSLELIDRFSGQVIRNLGSQLRLAEEIGNMQRQFVIAANPVYPLLASGAPDGLVRIWDLRKAGMPVTIAAHKDFIDAICFDPTGRTLVSCGDSMVKFWGVSDAKLLHSIKIIGGTRSIHYSADGSVLLVGGIDGRVIVINAGAGEIYKEIKHHRAPVDAVLFLPSREIVSASMDKVFLWSNETLSKKQSVQQAFPVNCLATSHEGIFAMGGGNLKWQGMQQGIDITGTVSLFDLRVGFMRDLKGHLAQVKSIAFNPDGNIIAGGSADGRLIAWDVQSGKEIFSVDAHAGDVTGVCFTSDGSFIASIGLDTAVRLWETSAGRLAATLLSLNDEDYVSITDEGYYSATKAALRSVMFRSDDEIFPFDQFDLQLNRPDKYLQRLGFALPQLIDAYAEAHKLRMKHLRFPSNASSEIDRKPPRIRIISAPPIGVSPSRDVQLTIAIESESGALDRLLVYCNDVPVHGQAGLDIQSLGLKGEMSVRIQLMTGDNKVQLCAVNKEGIESAKASFRTVLPGDQAKPNLYLLSVGISNYADSKFNLDYAAKDAQDLVDVIDKLQHRFSKVNSRILTDRAASRAAILQSRVFLEQTDIDDHVVILFAGHGTIMNLNYYFLPSDFNIDQIESTGITYDEIQSLLDGIPARRRLVLLDTCHAGEMEEFTTVTAEAPLGQGVKGRALREIQFANSLNPKKRQQRIPILERLPELFADLRRDSGANVIAAAAAMEYAREFNEIRNGVFTSCVIEALGNAEADKNGDGILTVSELYSFVTKKVIELTAGHQRPISRRENITDDFPVI
jgi:WD40 repeat protein/uncharacterized caspase-like protein